MFSLSSRGRIPLAHEDSAIKPCVQSTSVIVRGDLQVNKCMDANLQPFNVKTLANCSLVRGHSPCRPIELRFGQAKREVTREISRYHMILHHGEGGASYGELISRGLEIIRNVVQVRAGGKRLR